VSLPPPPSDGAPEIPSLPAHGSLRCPRCSATVAPDQDWCLECGAPARTRLAPTPNWQLPTVALGAIVLLAGAMLAFAFVKLTDDGSAPASTTPAAVTTAPPIVPVAATGPSGPTGTTGPTGPAATVPPAASTPTTTLSTPTTTLSTPTTTLSTPTTTLSTPTTTLPTKTEP
jgi:hypothetical protein